MELLDANALERAFAAAASTGARAGQDIVAHTAQCISMRNEKAMLQLLDGALLQAIHWHSTKRSAESRAAQGGDEDMDTEEWEANAIGVSERRAVRAAHEQVREALLLASRIDNRNSAASKGAPPPLHSLAWFLMQCAAEGRGTEV